MSWSDPGRWSVDKCLARVAELEAAKTQIEARQAELLARLIEYPDPICANVIPTNPKINRAQIEQLSITAEVACALHLSHESAHARMRTARRLVHELPNLFGLIRTGAVPYGHGVQLVGSSKDLDQPTLHKIEQSVLARAATQTAAEFRRAVKRAVAKYDPRSVADKHEAAELRRRVCHQPDQDGMAWVSAYLTAHDAQTVTTAVQVVADKMRADAGPADDRSADQLRADALAAICQAVLDGHVFVGAGRVGDARLIRRHGRRPTIHVSVALSTLLGRDEQPGELAGYGPIDARTARRLAADPTATWYRLVHDEVGHLIDYGRTRYRPPQDLTDHVLARDPTCRAPGCNRQSVRAELDHIQDWADGGNTNADNLHPLCRRHHHLKHDAGWRTERLGNGTIRWTTPSGRVHDKPPDRLPLDITRDTRPPPPPRPPTPDEPPF